MGKNTLRFHFKTLFQGMPSSSSDSKASDLNNKILTAAHAVDTKDVDAEVDRLIEYIIDLLEEKKTVKKPSKTEGAKHSWHSSSESLNKFREVLSEAINVFKDVFPGEAKTVTQGLLKGMGTAHLTTTGFLIAAHVLERFETVSSNRDNCLLVLDEICNMAQHVKKLRRRDGLREGMEHSIKEAMGLIVEASIMCSTQIGSSKGWRFLAAQRNKKELEGMQQRLQTMYRHMDNEFSICVFDAIDSRKAPPQKPRERPYPDYAVGIQEPLKEVPETVSSNRDICLLVLDEICNVAQHVKTLRQRDGLRKEMEHLIKEAMGLIAEASNICSTQIGSSKVRMFWTASRTKEKLEHLPQSLQKMDVHMGHA